MFETHTSGLSEPDIDSLLKIVQKDDSFGEETKPQRDKLAQTIVAVRDASRSKEWSNLLRGVIILTICLKFPKGDVSETHPVLGCMTSTNDDRKKEIKSQRITDHTNARFGCSTAGGTTSHRILNTTMKSLAQKCASG